MNTLRKLVVVAALGLAPLAVAPASAHGNFHGGGGGFGHGFGGYHDGGYDHHGYGHHYGWRYGEEIYPSYGAEYDEPSVCRGGYHLGEDGRCWPNER